MDHLHKKHRKNLAIMKKVERDGENGSIYGKKYGIVFVKKTICIKEAGL